jgi:peptide/nickel transport system ATP-binding protein
MSIMLITHDLGVVAENADVVAVMYAGRVVEYGSVDDVFQRPLHPYTRGLLRSMPVLGEAKHRLDVIPGQVPNPAESAHGLPVPSAMRCDGRRPAMRQRPTRSTAGDPTRSLGRLLAHRRLRTLPKRRRRM